MQERKAAAWAPWLKRGLQAVLIFALLLALMGWVVSESWSTQLYENDAVAHAFMTGIPSDGEVIEQGFTPECDRLDTVTLDIAPVGTLAGSLEVAVLRDGQVIASETCALASLADASASTLSLAFGEDGLAVGGARLTLRLTLHAEADGGLPAFWVGTMIDTGRFAVDAGNLDQLRVGGESVRGRLCMRVSGHSASAIMAWYWPVCAALTALAAGLVLLCAWQSAHGRTNFLLVTVELLNRYRFLIRQLVARDFNTKYRQSLLGVVWSFLNPLLTMVVQYIVFSTIFKSSIPNFTVYLLTGIVLFNFFSEATSLGLDSIVASGSLITKVYMPKYIYPLSRTLSSLINLVISLVPLLVVMLITGVPITKSLLLLPLVVAFTFVFSLGMAMILATLNVFFRDTRFLWSVVVLMWNYLTPIFYPETIIPAALQTLYHMNPLYQFIYFLRCITINGISPGPMTYVYCLLCSVVPLFIGLWVFKKNQDRFVFYL